MDVFNYVVCIYMVRVTGLEPARFSAGFGDRSTAIILSTLKS
jgi:hypothetical protein